MCVCVCVYVCVLYVSSHKVYVCKFISLTSYTHRYSID